MKKIIPIALVLLVALAIILLGVIPASTYYIRENNEAKAEYTEYFNRCLERTDQFVAEMEIEESLVADCKAQGGCYACAPCGVKPYKTILEIISDIRHGTSFCTAECVPTCLPHPDNYPRLGF